MTAKEIECKHWNNPGLLTGLNGISDRFEFFVPVKKDGTPYKNFSIYWPSEMIELKYDWEIIGNIHDK